MAEAHNLSRQRGSTGIGVKKRDCRSAMSSHATASQWKQHLRRPGREGGFYATITTPFSRFDARNPEAICNIPLGAATSDREDPATDSDDEMLQPDGTLSFGRLFQNHAKHPQAPSSAPTGPGPLGPTKENGDVRPDPTGLCPPPHLTGPGPLGAAGVDAPTTTDDRLHTARDMTWPLWRGGWVGGRHGEYL
jgi:hypothetical protein